MVFRLLNCTFAGEMKKKILFICLGNICRSPAADGIMRHLVTERGLEDEFLIDSAGIGSWHVGQLPDRRMRKCGQRHGYNFDHRARQFSSKDFERFDYIAVMDQENYHDVARQANTPDDLKKIIRMSDYLRHHPGQKTVPRCLRGAAYFLKYCKISSTISSSL